MQYIGGAWARDTTATPLPEPYHPTSTLGGRVGLGKPLLTFIIGTQPLLHFLKLTIPLQPWGVGWDNNAYVPVHTQAQQPHHLSCCPADTGTALSWSLTGGVGWGATITFMFLYTHRHSNLIIFLAVLQTQALLFHDQLSVGWGRVEQ